MSAIKWLVIGMGALILAGFIVIAVTLATRSQGDKPSRAPFAASISLPSGTQVLETSTSDEKIVLRVQAADSSQWLVVIDNDTGAEMGRIKLLPTAP
ncbi:MAG: DUF6476 family protein [Alphaproteobacteria bacterium]|jgi:hypothetical protein